MSFISGLGVGLLVAFGVYLWSGRLPLPWDPGPDRRPSGVQPQAREGAAASDAAAASALPRPRFDFYKILPEMEVPIPDWKMGDKPATAQGSGDEGLDRGTYLLQVGSFKRFEDADRVKATLALRGISASIQRVVINGQDVWYRVHVGPLTSAEEIRAMRAKLIENDMDFILLRIGGPGAEGGRS